MAKFLMVSAVPKMTSNTAPSGVVSTSSQYDATYSPYKVFDGTTSNTGWASSSGVVFPQYISYQFSVAIAITAYSLRSIISSTATDITQNPKDWTFEGSQNGIDWTILDTQTNQIGWETGQKRSYYFENSVSFLYYRIRITANNGNATASSIAKIEFYEYRTTIPGRSSQTAIPVMTSNIAPSGTVFASSVYNTTNFDSWKAFNGTTTNDVDAWISKAGETTGYLGYRFTSSLMIASYSLKPRNDPSAKDAIPKSWTFEGSNDGINWIILDTQNHLSAWSQTEEKEFVLEETKIGSFSQYRINILSPYSLNFGYIAIGEFKMFEYKPNKLQYSPISAIPYMTSETSPSGVVSASAFNASDFPYKAFDGSLLTSPRNFWNISNVVSPAGGHWIQYELPFSKIISSIELTSFAITAGQHATRDFIFYGSQDGLTYEKIYQNTHPNALTTIKYDFYNIKSFKFYRLNIINSYFTSSPSNYVGLLEMKMFEYWSGKPDFTEGPLALREIIYVATNGNDTTGKGTINEPYATIAKATISATSGMGIKISQGRFTLTPYAAFTTTSVGLYDLGKDLIFMGENNNTILEFFGSSVASNIRDACCIHIANSSSKICNLKIEYTPNRTANNYNSAIFVNCAGSFINVFIEKLGSTIWSYNYFNSPPAGRPVVENCIFKATNNATTDFSGNASYKNCIFKNLPSTGTKAYYLIREINEADYNINIPMNTDSVETGDPSILNKSDGKRSNIGVRGGIYDWNPGFTDAEKGFPTWILVKQPFSVPTSMYVRPHGIMTGLVDISPIYNASLPATNIEVKIGAHMFTSISVPPYNKMEGIVDIVPPPRTTVRLNSAQDAFTRKKVPRLNYGTEQEMLIGGKEDGDEFKSYIQFDLTSIPLYQKISKATLNLYYEYLENSEEYFRIKKLVDSWTELGITWSNSPAGTSVEANEPIPKATGYISIDLKELVTAWYNNPEENCGLLIETANLSEKTYRFSTRERNANKPYLEIEYYDPSPKSSDKVEFGTFINVQRSEVKNLNTKITIITKNRDLSLKTSIKIYNRDMVETSVVPIRRVFPTTIIVKQNANLSLVTNIQALQRNIAELPTATRISRKFMPILFRVRVTKEFMLPTNINIRQKNRQDTLTNIMINRPYMPTNIRVYRGSNLITNLAVEKFYDKDLITKLLIKQKDQKDLPANLDIWRTVDVTTDMKILSGYFATQIYVPHRADKNLRTRLIVREKFAEDLLTRIGIVNTEDLPTEIEIVEGSENTGFIIFF